MSALTGHRGPKMGVLGAPTLVSGRLAGRFYASPADGAGTQVVEAPSPRALANLLISSYGMFRSSGTATITGDGDFSGGSIAQWNSNQNCTWVARRNPTNDSTDDASLTCSNHDSAYEWSLALRSALTTLTSAPFPYDGAGPAAIPSGNMPTAPTAGYLLVVSTIRNLSGVSPAMNTPSGMTLLYDSGSVTPTNPPSSDRFRTYAHIAPCAAGLVPGPTVQVTASNGFRIHHAMTLTP